MTLNIIFPQANEQVIWMRKFVKTRQKLPMYFFQAM